MSRPANWQLSKSWKSQRYTNITIMTHSLCFSPSPPTVQSFFSLTHHRVKYILKKWLQKLRYFRATYYISKIMLSQDKLCWQRKKPSYVRTTSAYVLKKGIRRFISKENTSHCHIDSFHKVTANMETTALTEGVSLCLCFAADQSIKKCAQVFKGIKLAS